MLSSDKGRHLNIDSCPTQPQPTTRRKNEDAYPDQQHSKY